MSETKASAAAFANEPQDEVAQLAIAAREALTDSMVERLTTTGANAFELVDKLNNEDTKDALMTALDRLTDLHRVGALETLFSTVEVIHAARMTMNDNIVDRLFTFIEHMFNNLATEELATLTHEGRMAFEEAIDETSSRRMQGGLMSTIALLSKPETQNALQLMLAFACKMQRKAVELRHSEELEP